MVMSVTRIRVAERDYAASHLDGLRSFLERRLSTRCSYNFVETELESADIIDAYGRPHTWEGDA